jgi:hypothetical protein
MLHEFLAANRSELISRCRAKVAKRSPPIGGATSVLGHGVPLFLQQLVETLRREQTTNPESAEQHATPAPTAIGRAAALHGAELLRIGYTIDQVVHDYGDFCQAVTDLAIEKRAAIANEEFRTLNRCLDNAIADAVTAYGNGRDSSMIDKAFDQAEALHGRIGSLAEEQRRLIEVSIQAYSALRTGNVGMSGATSAVLGNALYELRDLVERTLPEIRLAAGMTAPLADAKRKTG